MLNDQGYDSYQAVSLEAKAASASPQELVLMLIDGLLDELIKIEGHIKAARYDAKAAATTKCMNIIIGLETALNPDGDKELFDRLTALYAFCQQQLYEASIHNEITHLAHVRDVMTNLREGWKDLGAQS